MITSARIADIPPFTDPVEFVFDEYVNLFIGPNAVGKSTILKELASRRYPKYNSGMFRYEDGLLHHSQMPWIFIPSVRTTIPSHDEILEWLDTLNVSQGDLSQILSRQEVRQDIFDGKIMYLASDEVRALLLDSAIAASKKRNIAKAKGLPDKCAQDICGEVLIENEQNDYFQEVPFSGNVIFHPNMAIKTIDINHISDDELFLGDLSSGTQGTLLWIWYLALRMAHHYDFCDGWEEKPAILLIDEIENHLHPTWQRRVIPALRKHFPGVQIFATTHSPFVVAGLKAGQVHLLDRDENGVVSASTHDSDIVGWTIEEILHSIMGVNALTDEETANKAARLQELQRKDALEGLTESEAAEMEDLRANVSRDILAGGALNAQRDRYADMMEKFLKSRLSETAQDKASD